MEKTDVIELATMKADLITVKSDIKELKTDFKLFTTEFPKMLDLKFVQRLEMEALKIELNNVKKELDIVRCQATTNSKSILKISREVAQWGATIGLIFLLVKQLAGF